MPRKALILSDVTPYHLTARSNNREWFKIPMGDCFKIFMDVLKKTKEVYGFEFHVFILMSNHFHMIASTPYANLDKGMRYFMTETSRRIARATGRINKIYGQRYHWTQIKNPIHYAHVYRYDLQNPLRANIVLNVEDYEWSSLNTSLFFVENKSFSEYLPQGKEDMKNWLNNVPEKSFNEKIKKALRKFEFRFAKDPNTKKYTDYMNKL